MLYSKNRKPLKKKNEKEKKKMLLMTAESCYDRCLLSFRVACELRFAIRA